MFRSKWYIAALFFVSISIIAGGAVMLNGYLHSYHIITDGKASIICGGGTCGFEISTTCASTVAGTCTGAFSCGSKRCGYTCLEDLDAVPGSAFQNERADYPCRRASEWPCSWNLYCVCDILGTPTVVNCGTTHIPSVTCAE